MTFNTGTDAHVIEAKLKLLIFVVFFWFQGLSEKSEAGKVTSNDLSNVFSLSTSFTLQSQAAYTQLPHVDHDDGDVTDSDSDSDLELSSSSSSFGSFKIKKLVYFYYFVFICRFCRLGQLGRCEHDVIRMGQWRDRLFRRPVGRRSWVFTLTMIDYRI